MLQVTETHLTPVSLMGYTPLVLFKDCYELLGSYNRKDQ